MEYPYPAPTPERLLALTLAVASPTAALHFEDDRDGYCTLIDQLDSLGWLLAENVRAYDEGTADEFESVRIGNITFFSPTRCLAANGKLQREPIRELTRRPMVREAEQVAAELHVLSGGLDEAGIGLGDFDGGDVA